MPKTATLTATHTVTIEDHAAASLVRDERVQRAIIDRRVRELANSLDLDGIGVVTVSKRDDGRLYILDGQHRQLALLEAGMGEWIITCRVYHGLSLPEEAAIFRVLNNTRKPNAFDDYMKGVLAGDPECVAIHKIVQRTGLRVALQSGDGLISCIAAARKIYRSSPGVGPAALGFALHVAVGAWGAHSDSVDGHIVGGLGQIYIRYAEEIDRAAMIRKLAKFPGGAPGLIGRARHLREMRPGTVSKCVAILTVDVYNRGRREQLPPL